MPRNLGAGAAGPRRTSIPNTYPTCNPGTSTSCPAKRESVLIQIGVMETCGPWATAPKGSDLRHPTQVKGTLKHYTCYTNRPETPPRELATVQTQHRQAPLEKQPKVLIRWAGSPQEATVLAALIRELWPEQAPEHPDKHRDIDLWNTAAGVLRDDHQHKQWPSKGHAPPRNCPELWPGRRQYCPNWHRHSSQHKRIHLWASDVNLETCRILQGIGLHITNPQANA